MKRDVIPGALGIGSPSDAERSLFARVDQECPPPHWDQLNVGALESITAREGVDFATATLYLSLRRSAEQSPLIDALEHQCETRNHHPLDPQLLVGIVPGGCYKESDDSRQSVRLVRDEVMRLGFDTETVPVESFGCLLEQAAVVQTWLAAHTHRKVILVSLSKGGAEVKLALNDDPQVFRHVEAWVNVSGLLFGSQWVSWLLNRTISRWGARCWCWYWGYSFAVLKQLCRGQKLLLDFDFEVPAHMEIIHIYGFPLTGGLSHPYTRRSFARLATDGPNDGMGVMLGDLARLPGRIYPVWGADHFLRAGECELHDFVSRVLHYLIGRHHFLGNHYGQRSASTGPGRTLASGERKPPEA